jgi:hypothetical protein
MTNAQKGLFTTQENALAEIAQARVLRLISAGEIQ